VNEPPDAPTSPPPAADRLALLSEEIGRPLRAARLNLALLRGRGAQHQSLRATLLGVTEAETIQATAMALCFGLAPKLERVLVDLGAMVSHSLAQLPWQDGHPRIPLTLSGPVVGQWSRWLCRRLVRELLAFPVAISDRLPAVAVRRKPGAGLITIQLPGADLGSPEAQTFRHELGPTPRQSHLWLAARLAQLHGGQLQVGATPEGWVELTAELPEAAAERPPEQPLDVSPEQRRALIHLMRSPLSAARLRLRLLDVDPPAPQLIADVEQQLVAADGALARLVPLTGGAAALEPVPGDLADLVGAAVRAAAPSATMRAPSAPRRGCWDGVAIECIVRNLMHLSGSRPAHPAEFTLRAAPGGARLVMTSSTENPPADGARRWLIQQLAAAHGGWLSLSFRPGRLAAEVFLGDDAVS
jgi:hypothetical protein